MSDTGDAPLDPAEALDNDNLGIDDDAEVEPGYPPDRPLGVEDYGLTPAEEQVGEPIEESVEREIPDPLVQELDGSTGPPEQADPEQADDGSVPAEEAALHVDDGGIDDGAVVDPVVDDPPTG